MIDPGALRGALLPLILAAALVPGGAAAQEGSAPPEWSAALHYDAQQVARSPAAYWHTVTLAVQRRMRTGSVEVQGIGTRRFDLADQALVLDAYRELWRGAYGNVRVQYAPEATVLPEYVAGAELFQAIGRVEVAGSYTHQEYAVADANTLGLGLGYYVGQWYLRQRVLAAAVEGAWSPATVTSARRYLGGGTENTIDLSVGFGEEVLEVAPIAGTGAVDVVTTESRFVSARTRRFLGPGLGLVVGANYSRYSGIADRWGVSVGAIVRW